MQEIVLTPEIRRQSVGGLSPVACAILMIGFLVFAAWLISWNPIQLSIVTVFLFAGPHNWVEFRYFLGRMPRRWGSSRLFYSVGLSGVAVLAIGYIGLYAAGQAWYLSTDLWFLAISIWNTALIMWLIALVYLRGRKGKNQRWPWVLPAGFLLCAASWIAPVWFSLSLVYLHPLIALWFLDRQLRSMRSPYRRPFHWALISLLIILVFMWSILAGTPHVVSDDALSLRIANHAGAFLLTGVPGNILVATHVFLETVHYAVWLVVLPLTAGGIKLLRTEKIALAKRGTGWPRITKLVLLCGVAVVFVLWAAFIADYPTTRDIYFAVAIGHVLAEAPFLIRML